MFKEIKFNLQLFADGGTAAASVGGEGTGVVNGTSAEGTVTGTAPHTEASDSSSKVADGENADTKMSFDEWLKTNKDFEKEYKKRVEKAVKDRAKNLKADNDKYAQIRRNMSAYHGIDYDDLDGMVAKSEEWRKDAIKRKALETGDSEELIAENEKNKFEARSYKEQLEAIKEQNAINDFNARIAREMEIAKETYPDIDFEKECEDRVFRTMINMGFGVQNVYESVHHKELLDKAVADAVKDASEKISNSIASGVNRPSENGIKNTSPGNIQKSPKDFTKEERANIKERVRRGERITEFY